MTEAEMQELEDMVALRDARRRSWLLTTTAGAAVRVRMARRRGDGNTPSSPAEVTTLGTPKINPTPKALFPGSPTPRKGLGIMFCEGEDDETEEEGRPGEDDKTESLGQREKGLSIMNGAGEDDETESLDQRRKEIEDAEAAYYASSPQ